MILQKCLAISSVLKQPETFFLTLLIRRSLSAWLFVASTSFILANRRTSDSYLLNLSQRFCASVCLTPLSFLYSQEKKVTPVKPLLKYFRNVFEASYTLSCLELSISSGSPTLWLPVKVFLSWWPISLEYYPLQILIPLKDGPHIKHG